MEQQLFNTNNLSNTQTSSNLYSNNEEKVLSDSNNSQIIHKSSNLYDQCIVDVEKRRTLDTRRVSHKNSDNRSSSAEARPGDHMMTMGSDYLMSNNSLIAINLFGTNPA
jgi:hypothetical protein